MEVTKVNENNTIDFICDRMLHKSVDAIESKLDREDMEDLGYVRCVDWDGIIRYVDSGDIWGFKSFGI